MDDPQKIVFSVDFQLVVVIFAGVLLGKIVPLGVKKIGCQSGLMMVAGSLHTRRSAFLQMMMDAKLMMIANLMMDP